MHDIWNPWHGCVRVSPGCANCYMYFLDRQRGQDGRHIYRTSSFDYPLQRDQAGRYRVHAKLQPEDAARLSLATVGLLSACIRRPPLQAMRKPAHLQWLQPLREMP